MSGDTRDQHVKPDPQEDAMPRLTLHTHRVGGMGEILAFLDQAVSL
jgi:hypothetical protein